MLSCNETIQSAAVRSGIGGSEALDWSMSTRAPKHGWGLAPCTGVLGQRRQSACELRNTASELLPALSRQFEVIYRREYPIALSCARHYADRDTASDVVAEVFAAYWKGYSVRPPRVFGADEAHTHAAILAAVRNRLRSLHRGRLARQGKERQIVAEVAMPIRKASAPEGPLAALELYETVAWSLDALPTRQREVFCLVRFDERSYEEAAAALRISSSTVRQHLVKASERMRVALSEYRDGQVLLACEVYDDDVIVRTAAGQA